MHADDVDFANNEREPLDLLLPTACNILWDWNLLECRCISPMQSWHCSIPLTLGHVVEASPDHTAEKAADIPCGSSVHNVVQLWQLGSTPVSPQPFGQMPSAPPQIHIRHSLAYHHLK